MKIFLWLQLLAKLQWSGAMPLSVLILATLLALVSANAQEHIRSLETVKSIFSDYCNECHSGPAADGGLDMSKLGLDLEKPEIFPLWERIHDRIEAGEMPPKDSSQMPFHDRSKLMQLVASELFRVHSANKATTLRRLNRREYQNTMNDIFGTDVDIADRLPADGRSHEFDNIGVALGISPVHLQQYLHSADAVIDAAVAKSSQRPPEKTISASYANSREGEQFIGKLWKKLPDESVVFFQNLGYPTGMLRGTEVPLAGRYRIRVTGYAYRSDSAITFRVGGTSFLRGSEKPTYGYFELHPGAPQTVELEAIIPLRTMVEIAPWGLDTRGYNLRDQGVDNYEGPGLAIQQVELIGPLYDEFPSRGHRLLFAGFERTEVPPKNSRSATVFALASPTVEEDTTAALLRVAEKAFRRRVDPVEIEPFLELFELQRSGGENLEQALRTAVAAIFCSPKFIYLDEPDGWLDDNALAARLSYFLTRTTPDEELLLTARKGELTDSPNALLSQTQRLLSDNRHFRFIEDFCDVWLNLRDIDFTSPDQTLFPEYDAFLQESMLQETRGFIDKLFADNLPIENLIASEFAMLNNRLARHYDISGVDGPEIREVELPQNSIRGGVLAQASVLKVSANGTNTSPVVRGVWFMERILGKPPLPPPPGVPGVEPDIRGATTLRELLDKHRSLESCRACHSVIDPPGFALECFNPIGGYRERFRSLGDGEKVLLEVAGRKVRYRLGPEVDSSGVLPDGRTFSNFVEFRRLLAADPQPLARALVTKLLTFATGREMGFSDRNTINRIVEQSKATNYRMQDMIKLVVTSEAFRKK